MRKVGQVPAAKDVGARRGEQAAATARIARDFDDKFVDLISTATPNHWYLLTCIWAMQAGKDVYVEKPVSHNVSEGRRMVETARKYNRIARLARRSARPTGPRTRCSSFKVRKIGEVKLTRFVLQGPRFHWSASDHKVPASVDYNLWCGPAPMDPLSSAPVALRLALVLEQWQR